MIPVQAVVPLLFFAQTSTRQNGFAKKGGKFLRSRFRSSVNVDAGDVATVRLHGERGKVVKKVVVLLDGRVMGWDEQGHMLGPNELVQRIERHNGGKRK